MKAIVLVGGFAVFLQIPTQAQLLTTPNLLNDGVHVATVTTNTNYPGFSPAKVDDLTSGDFVFDDYLRHANSTTINDQLMSLSNLYDPTGITSLRLFDDENYEIGRVPTQVTIYYTTSTLVGSSALLNSANYTALNGGTAFTLALDGSGHFAGGAAVGASSHYDDLLNLAIPANTTSILLDFGVERESGGGPFVNHADGVGPGYNVGAGIDEIQAFPGLSVPEPGTWAMLAGGLLILALAARRQLAPVRS